MGGILNVTDATSEIDLPSILGFTMPDIPTTSLIGLYLLDGFEPATENVGTGADASFIGTPLRNALGYTLNGMNGLQTGIAETNAMTIAVITKPRATGSNLIIYDGQSSGGVVNGMALHFGDGGSGSILRAGAQNAGGAYQQAQISPSGSADPADWNVVFGAWSATQVIAGWSADGIYRESAPMTITGGRTLSGTIRIGGAVSGGGTYGNEFEVLAVAIYNATLSETNRHTLVHGLREWAATAGITTL